MYTIALLILVIVTTRVPHIQSSNSFKVQCEFTSVVLVWWRNEKQGIKEEVLLRCPPAEKERHWFVSHQTPRPTSRWSTWPRLPKALLSPLSMLKVSGFTNASLFRISLFHTKTSTPISSLSFLRPNFQHIYTEHLVFVSTKITSSYYYYYYYYCY